MSVAEDPRQIARALALAGNISGLLQAAEGSDHASNELYQLVEQDLKQIARKRKRAAGAAAAVSTTVLVNDAFCRLVGRSATFWAEGDRRKFFGYMSRKIHDLLINELNKQRTEKRGGGVAPEELAPEEGSGPCVACQADPVDSLLDLKEVLARLEAFDLESAILFRIRYFLDCTFDETAEIMGLSKTETVRRYQRTSLWLKSELKDYDLGV